MKSAIPFVFFLAASSAFSTEATMSYGNAKPLEAAGKPIEIGSHASTRVFDWDADGDLDLVAGGGDGRLWLFRRSDGEFGEREPITAGSRKAWGRGYTGAVLARIDGKPNPALVVAHSNNQVSIHENAGTLSEPEFSEQSRDFTIQEGCHGRIDVADWNGDGLLDLIAGSFGGAVTWHQNQSRPGELKFAEGQSLQGISRAYNSHPRVVDFNRDGLPDLLLGVNWGSVELFLNHGAEGNPDLKSAKQLTWAASGKPLNIRELNGDDTTPELADLDGDGVLDLLSGGKNGKLFLMRGMGIESRLADFRAALKAEPADSVRALGVLKSLQADFRSELIPDETRAKLIAVLAGLSEEFPDFLRRRQFDLESNPLGPVLAAQFWVTLFEAGPDTPTHRELTAKAGGFTGGYQHLLVDLGVIFIDNDTATAEHLEAMHRLMMAMPRSVWDVETITTAGWLGEGFKEHKISSRTGVNIFAIPLGQKENSFAGDAPRPGVTDVFLICLAHEVAHNMLDTIGRRLRPELFEAKFAGLDLAAGPDVFYRSPKAQGIDWEKTKARFKEIGAWDGKDATWKDSWKSYFRNLKNAPRFDKAYVRGNVQFFLDAPQEAFATLANQYFADSQLMLEFCKTRWDDGFVSNVNQFLLIAYYLSENSDSVRFYKMEPGGALKVETAKLARDDRNRIVEVHSARSVAHFQYDGDGLLVSGFEVETIDP